MEIGGERERDRERKKGDKNRAKQSARFEFASASLPNPRGIRLRCTLAYLSDKISPPPLPSPFSFPTFSIQSARTRERGGRRFVAITSDLARICGGYSVKTRPNFSSFFVFYLQEKNHWGGERGGRGKLETKLWKIGELNYDVSWIDVYFTFSWSLKGERGGVARKYQRNCEMLL